MRRSLVALLAASLAGCLGAYSPGGGSDPGSSSTSGGGSTTGGGPSGGSSATNGGGGGGTSNGAMSGGGTSTGNPGSGSGMGMAGPPSPTGSLSLALDATSASVRLNESKTVNLTVTPTGGFNGMVQLVLDNPPAGLTATFTPPGMMMTGTTPQSVQVAVSVPSDFTPATGVKLSIKATSGTITASTPLTLDVPAELLVSIPNNVDIGTSAQPNLSAFGAPSIPTLFIQPGTTVTFINNDGINHQIHSDGSLGIQHEGGPLMANGANTYTQQFNSSGTFDFRCHIHPNMKGQIVVK